MPKSLTFLNTHTVFSTKNRFPFLKNHDICLEMHSYLGGVLKTLDSAPIIIGGVSDHVHLLYRTSKNITVSQVIGELKRVSSVWIKKQGGLLADFQWQVGYGAFSVGKSEIHTVTQYIKKQENHHKEMSFQDEYRQLLQEYEMEFDERYLWD